MLSIYKRHFLYKAFAIPSAFYCSNAYRAEPEAFSCRQEAPPSPPLQQIQILIIDSRIYTVYCACEYVEV
jgi:hypothetical protein